MPRPKNADYIKLYEIPAILYELTGLVRASSTIKIWARKGVVGKHGHRVRLKTAKRLGKRYTTRQWVEEFLGEF